MSNSKESINKTKIEKNDFNGRKQEFINGKLVYDGEFLNGKRNGKGKEFENNILIYDGEFLDGERNGKGREFEYGILIYEGNFLEGERNGKGKEFENGVLVYDGCFLNGKRQIVKDTNFQIFEDFAKKNYIKIYKEYNFITGEIEYEGEILNGKWNGLGKKYYRGILDYVGRYSNGKISGKGEEYDEKGILRFEGEYLNGKKWNGKGYDNNGNEIYQLVNGKGLVK